MWISRKLGPEAFGQFSYFLSVIIYISAIDSLCHESIVKQYVTHNADTGLVLGTAATLNAILALASTLFILVFGYFTIPESIYLVVFFLFIPGQFSKPLNPIANFFDIRLLSKYSSFALFVGAIVSILFRAISILYSTDLAYQSLGYSLQTIVYAGTLYWFYKQHLEAVRWKVSFELLLEMAKRSFPLFISALLFLSLSQSDIFMIRHMIDIRAVGIYSIVVKLSEPWVIVSSALCTSFFPLIFNSSDNKKKQAKYFIRANQLSIYFVVALGITLSLAINLIISILLGEQYSEVSGVFRIYIWSILFFFFANIQHIWEVFHRKYSVSLVKTACACFLKIALNFVFGSIFGLKGFAISSLLTLCFYGLGFNFISKTTKPYLQLQLSAFKIGESKKNLRFLIRRSRRWLKKEF